VRADAGVAAAWHAQLDGAGDGVDLEVRGRALGPGAAAAAVQDLRALDAGDADAAGDVSGAQLRAAGDGELDVDAAVAAAADLDVDLAVFLPRLGTEFARVPPLAPNTPLG
jgi:hypothetical protein